MSNDNKIIPIESARGRHARDAKQDDLEAFSPEAEPIGGDDHVIVGCDGEQHYVWLATRKKNAKNYKVSEVYPGALKRKTAIRDLKDPDFDVSDVVQNAATIDDVLAELEGVTVGDLVLDGDGTDGAE